MWMSDAAILNVTVGSALSSRMKSRSLVAVGPSKYNKCTMPKSNVPVLAKNQEMQD